MSTKTAKKRVKQKHYFLLRISKNKTIRIGVPVSDARHTIALSREVSDVLAGTEGMSITCANANCVLRQDSVFPHPVLMASFTDNRCFIVDKVDRRGVPSHCVRYAHNEGAFQREYDTKGKNKLAKMSGVEKLFVLAPPPAHRAAGKGVSHGGTSGPDGKAMARKRELSGDLARALRAGFKFDKPTERKAA